MNGIQDLQLMLESRSTDYGKMRQILSCYLLNVDSRVAKLKKIAKGLVDENDALLAKLKVSEDALTKLQDRLVSSVHDGTIDPYEALKIAEDALAAIREEGAAK